MAQRALFIGVDDYPFAPLSSCVNDAVAMRDALVGLKVFRPEECTLMTSPAAPGSVGLPTRGGILGWFLPLYELTVPLDRLLVFFAGHGMSVRLGREAGALRTVLLPADVRGLKNAGGDMIDADELVGRFARRGAREQYWIVDACRNLPPDGTIPNVAPLPWDVPAAGDPRDAFEMARSVLYAVAPLGQARALAAQHGYLTTHVLDGLACAGPAHWGASAVYDERRDSWLVDLQSLGDYAAGRIGADLPADSWDRDYLLPRVWSGEKVPGPLRDVGALENRPFVLQVEPPQAASVVQASLSVKRNTVAAWPPKAIGAPVPLPPERYRLTATLTPGTAGWLPPSVPDPVVDLRLHEHVRLRVEAAGVAVSAAPVQAAPPLTEQFVPPVLVHADGTPVTGPLRHARFLNTPDGYTYVRVPPQVIVRAIDPGASVRLTKLSGGRDRRAGPVGAPITIEAGLWRVEVLLGDEVIAVREEDFADSQRYEISATAQITPALMALIPPQAEGAEGPLSLMPSETIGPMQGAVLPTLLPMLALKPFDHAGVILNSFSPRLGIPSPPSWAAARSGVAVAVALDGPWKKPPDAADAPAPGVDMSGPPALTWSEESGRVSIFARAGNGMEDGVRIMMVGWGALDVAAPSLDGYCATIAATLWAAGRYDVSISLFRLPPGVDQAVRPARLSRALTIASRLYRARASLDDVDYDVFSMMASGSWGDPVLGALAWFGRRRHLVRAAMGADRRSLLEQRQGAVRAFLTANVPNLPDTRVIAALTVGDAAVDALLDDRSLRQPVLADAVSVLARRAIARGESDHWSVLRYQQLDESAVFNVVRQPPPRGGRGES